MHIATKHEGKGKYAKDLHLFHTYAIQNEVSGDHLPDDGPPVSLDDVDNTKLLPSLGDHTKLRRDMVVLWSRVLINRVPAFKELRKSVVWHIPHAYTETMSKKSTTVSSASGLIQFKMNNVIQVLCFPPIGVQVSVPLCDFQTISSHLNLHTCMSCLTGSTGYHTQE